MKHFHNPAMAVDVPAGWRTLPIKYAAYVKGRIGWHGLSSDDYSTEGCHLVTGTDLSGGVVNWTSCQRVSSAIYDQDPYIQLREGDVLVTKDGTIGKLGVVENIPGPATLNSGLFVVRPEGRFGFHPRFLYYVLSSAILKEFISFQAAGSTISHLYQETFVNMPHPSPPMSEQRAIADFLDRETARIDALIERKDRLVNILYEGVTAETEELLRRHAEKEVALRRLLLEPPQYGAGESGEHGEEDWPRYIRITDLNADGTLRYDDIRRLAPSVALPFLLQEGDVLFARSGATVGKAFRYRHEMGSSCFAGYLIRFRVDTAKMAPELLEAWTRTSHYWGQIRGASLQATIENVSAERYKELTVPVPSPENQRLIISKIRSRKTRVGHLEAALQPQLQLLRERRQALITAAVTGQLDIQGAA